MKVEVEMREGKKEIEIPEGFTGEDLLKKLGLAPDSVLIIVNGEPVPYKEKINGNKIRIIRVVSGG